MNNLIRQLTYNPIVKRDIINKDYKKIEFIEKIDEEIKEVKDAYTSNESLSDHESEELMDIIFVCINTLIHFRLSVLKTFFNGFIKNVIRAKGYHFLKLINKIRYQ